MDPQPTADGHVIEVTDADFAERVVEESRVRPVVVDFWAAWCQPCRILGPVLERIAEERGGAFLLAKMDVDANPQTSSQFQIQSIPNVWAFEGGRPVDQFVGALPEPAVRQWIDRLVPSEADRAAEGAAVLEENDPDAAEREYRRVLGQDPGNASASLGLARVLASRGDLDEARELLTPLLPDPEAERVLAAIRVSEWGSAPLATDLDRAKAEASEGRFEEALAAMLAIVRDDPDVREAMLDVFAVLGDDLLTREYRQKLASALF